MAITNAGMVTMANAFRTGYTYAALHSASGGGNGATNEITACGREAFTWAAATGDGDFDISAQIDFTSVGASQAVYSVSVWDSGTSQAGNCGGEWALTGDAAANAAGEYSVTSIAQNGSST